MAEEDVAEGNMLDVAGNVQRVEADSRLPRAMSIAGAVEVRTVVASDE